MYNPLVEASHGIVYYIMGLLAIAYTICYCFSAF